MRLRHPGPLQELPLEQFLLPDPNIPQSSVRPSKRPLSPGIAKLLSPAKRRVLNEDGLLLTQNTKSSSSRTPRQSSFGRFADVLNGPGSPAKVLDFGPPKNNASSLTQEAGDAVGTTPRRPVTRSMTKLAPPSELNPSPSSSRHSIKELADYNMFNVPSSYPSTERPLLYVPRDLPATSDPLSIHYPGFEIHRDPYTIVFPRIDVAQQESSKEEVKENIPCKQQSRKVSDKDKAEARSRDTSQEPGNDWGSANLSSPKKTFDKCPSVSTSQSISRRIGLGSLPVSSRTSCDSKIEASLQRERKMKMMEEIDHVGGDIDEEMRQQCSPTVPRGEPL